MYLVKVFIIIICINVALVFLKLKHNKFLSEIFNFFFKAFIKNIMIETLDINFLISSFIALFIIVDSIGNVPIFLALLEEYTKKERDEIIKKSCIIATISLIGFIIIGRKFLQFLGIEFYSFKIAGGILLLIISVEMLFGKKTLTEYSPEIEKRGKEDIIVTPLAIPLLTGPGAITVGLMYFSLAKDLLHKILLFINIIVVFFISYIILKEGVRLFNLLGKTGTKVIARLMGLILASIAVEFIISGIRTAF